MVNDDFNQPTLAGSLEPPGPPGSMSSAMYSVNDICERLKTGAEPELKPFRGPTSGPGVSSGCNLNEAPPDGVCKLAGRSLQPRPKRSPARRGL
ncbi:MAG: hypothetical protein HC877_18005 [Thioploca sp.]|nr:hypothetical protein [Thioploca sp.]